MNSVINFLQQVLKLLSLQQKGQPDNNTKEVKDAYSWLLEKMKEKGTEVEEDPSPNIEPGKIYVFEYEAKYPDRYSYWDRNPVVLGLGKLPTQNGYVRMGINISWYPPKARKYIVEKIQELYKSKYKTEIKKNGLKANKQKSINIDLYALKLALDSVGLSFAIRSYLDEGIGNKFCISYEHWDKAIRLDNPGKIPQLEGKIPLSDIYKDYENYIRYYQTNKGKILLRMEASKKQNKYTFIK